MRSRSIAPSPRIHFLQEELAVQEADNKLEEHQLAWGMKAAKDWLRLQGIMIASGPPVGARIPSIIGVREATEVMLNVITQATICTSEAREAMHRTAEWKSANPDGRTTGIFVPIGYGQNAKEVLGLYDFCAEYEVL